MKLRLILLNLTLMAFFSASVGGYLYYSSLKEAAFKEAEKEAAMRVAMIAKNLASFLSENVKPVKALAGTNEISHAFMHGEDNTALVNANAILDHFNYALGTDVCYLMARNGETLASSNRHSADSFVGKNFNFRPYFRQAIKGKPSTYMALGTTSGKRGAYYGHPVYGKDPVQPMGVAVIKASIENIEKDFTMARDEIMLVTDPNGVVFISSQEDWLYDLVRETGDDVLAEIKQSLQFGNGPWKWIGLETDGKYAFDKSGVKYLIHSCPLENYPDWRVIHLRDLDVISKKVSGPLIKITGPVVLVLCVLIGFSAFFLYKKASHEIHRREEMETALRKSEERYRTIYHNTPAMLHSVNREGRLISISDHWTEAMGYSREEVIGKKLAEFLTEESGKFVETTVLPEFLKTGECDNIPYQFIRRDGQIMDIILSAFGERDDTGEVVRSLAVSVDVTEQRRAETALKLAKEELDRYSKELERQVRERTGEITAILKYAPDVIYFKDREGRYLLVNSRFEKLFGVCNEDIRGKTDEDFLPPGVAERLRKGDDEAVSENRTIQFEECVPGRNGDRTYLAVKFPVYVEDGSVFGVSGIFTDVTALKKAQDRLRRLSGNIMANQEQERSAVARELHDELGQVLTALRMDAVWILNRLKGTDSKAEERALTMCELIDNTILEVRNLALRLRPGVLDDLGLVDALEWYTTDFERRTEIACVFEHGAVPAVAETVATAAYRIAQEAMTNVARHAEAKRVNVTLQTTDGDMALTVEDNGRGFDATGLSEAEGLGVAGMRERAALAGGFLDVCSEAGKGTRVVFIISLSGRPD